MKTGQLLIDESIIRLKSKTKDAIYTLW